jgi:hypothetical protein
MTAKVKRNEAALRCRNTESLRIRLFRMIKAGVEAGKLSDAEAAQLRREFWEARAHDKKLARGGGVKSLNVARSNPDARARQR